MLLLRRWDKNTPLYLLKNGERRETNMRTATGKDTSIMNDERNKFETWWKETGQFVCASGQPEQKLVILEAWLAGYHAALAGKECDCDPVSRP